LISSDIIRGHLDSIILRLIYEKDRYGYEISKEIGLRTNDRFQIKEASLYAVFQRLEKKEIIESYFGDVSHGGKRRYYRITSLGKAYLKEKMIEWQETKEIIDIFMEGLK
jgi:PadR family transcriptional regulator, regulatory protein PadR